MAYPSNARGNPVRDPTLSVALAATGVGEWTDVRGCTSINIMLRHTAFVGTIDLNASFDGITDDGIIQAALTVGDPDANIVTDPVPFVRVNVRLYTSGALDEVFIYGVPR